MHIDIIEKCMKIIPNKFELILLVNQRICEINSGIKLDNNAKEVENDKKNTVIALEEIAFKKININELKQKLIKTYTTNKNTSGIIDFMGSSIDNLDIMQQLDPTEESGYDDINEDAILSSNNENDKI
ncbi:DNA-directed RNA polymerase subunit omega [Candidatus Xenohaliotis californiensis]|uniref:DNA-directed RNA polymerase subunit omega n=1 Tax=Candidatus Xenohaliotis californiensis TaxID=84677 RepID=A0ABP0EVL0_9RICK|nr:DNA-directed RNA polymerase subunit omega [Candidatus Xenohaliotis californiensis]